MSIEKKEKILKRIKALADGSLPDNATAFFKELGYSSNKKMELSKEVVADLFINNQTASSDKALLDEWKSVDFLFQLTEDELSTQHTLFSVNQYNPNEFQSYVFLAIGLKKEQYAKGKLSQITREVNKLFPMPAMILFRHGNTLTFSIINRRPHKKDTSKDVLKKVTLIKDINTENPHRAHIEILFDLSFEQLRSRYAFANFLELHNAWLKTLDTSELNKSFYKKIAAWYFWAVQNVEFPADAEENAEIRNATSVIRLLTRLIFVWFLKEKGLVPDDLFNQNVLNQILNYKDKKKSSYYKAILQNLFFATLNTQMDKDKPGSRRFRHKAKEKNQRDKHYMIHNVFRYEDYFINPRETFKKYFNDIPFLNGGLFECLDREEEKKGKKTVVRIDGFSDHKKNVIEVPDDLFFSDELQVDLNEIYHTRNKTYKVRGIIKILDSYKFTIDENTPIEEEIALDPELLGKVFENLLASYNPETGTTARKKTGSFYTPREIVNYMVDESLIAYLETQYIKNIPLDSENDKKQMNKKIRQLLSYTEEPHRFNKDEVNILIEAVDNVKILDPACGSGAFPMGILHKLVFILGKFDPNNERWKQTQVKKVLEVSDSSLREKLLDDIEQAFQNNELDYGRKLYLIENCIYGVDIQPIAVQISKLRFFISLVVDQKVNLDAKNIGIIPLPNLETKFVAANTLIGIEKSKQLAFKNPEIACLEKDLKKVRERHFTARTPQTKEKCRQKDKRLRIEISQLLINDGWHDKTAKLLADWNPYDQNATSGFFEPKWMFSITHGFDVVMGNPPYISALVLSSIYGESFRKQIKHSFKSAQGSYDIFVVFIERSLGLLQSGGILSFITPNKYLSAKYAVALRKYINTNATFFHLVDVSKIRVFEETAVYPVLSFFKKSAPHQDHISVLLPQKKNLEKFAYSDFFINIVPYALLKMLPENIWGFLLSKHVSFLPRIIANNETMISFGEINATSTAKEADEYGAFISDKILTGAFRIINTGTIDRYVSLWGRNEFTHQSCHFLTPYLHLKKAGVNLRRQEMYKSPKIIFAKMARTCEAYLDEKGEYASLNTNCFYNLREDISLKYILGVCNSRVFMFIYKLFFGALRMSGGYFQFQAPQLRVMPIVKPTKDIESSITNKVSKVVKAKTDDVEADTSIIEAEIDARVAHLYELNEEEYTMVLSESNCSDPFRVSAMNAYRDLLRGKSK